MFARLRRLFASEPSVVGFLIPKGAQVSFAPLTGEAADVGTATKDQIVEVEHIKSTEGDNVLFWTMINGKLGISGVRKVDILPLTDEMMKR